MFQRNRTYIQLPSFNRVDITFFEIYFSLDQKTFDMYVQSKVRFILNA